MGVREKSIARVEEVVATVVVLPNGEIPIPAELLARRGWGPGTELEVVHDGDDVIVRRRTTVQSDDALLSPQAFLALVPKVDGDYPTDAEIAEIVSREAAERFDDETRR